MKKLMFSAAAATLAGVALADMPAVYDYKASVKHMYLKEVNVTIKNWLNQNETVKVYQKYQKSASLKGYLIHDAYGATSAYASRKRLSLGAYDANNYGPEDVSGAAVAGKITDQVNSRAFLVVQNSSAEAAVRRPKILPAVLETKFFDTKYKMTWNAGIATPTYTAGVAEGTLFVGGDFVAGVRPYLNPDRTVAQDGTPANYIPRNMYGDYGWTSIYLFGKFNSANGAQGHIASQAAIAANTVQKIPSLGNAGRVYFHDTWMNGAGIGKYTTVDDSEQCCGFQTGGVSFALDSLAGNLKGGLFLCSENGRQVSNYTRLGGFGWEDQFFNERIWAATTWAADTDASQDDVWADGEVDQNTTDVLYGTWSIKRIATARVPVAALTTDEITRLSGVAKGGTGIRSRGNGVAGITDLEDLNNTIKGCAFALNSNVEFTRNPTGIPAIVSGAGSQTARQTVPFITRDFAKGYGLMRYVAY